MDLVISILGPVYNHDFYLPASSRPIFEAHFLYSFYIYVSIPDSPVFS